MDREDAISALVSLEPVTRINVASLKPTDVIVVECDSHLSFSGAARVRELIQLVWPNNRVVVLERDLHLKVVDGADIAPDA